MPPLASPTRTALLIGALLLASAAQAQTSQLLITVRDSATGDPVRNARVEIAGVQQRGQTNGDGAARIGRVPAGNRIVSVSRIGYRTTRVAVEFAGEPVERTVTLATEPVEVGGVTVRGEARDRGLEMYGFYARQERGLGDFMTAERIEELRPSRTVDLFRHIRGFKVEYDRRRGEYYVVSSRGAASMGADCVGPQVYLDGTLVGDRAHYMQFIGPENIAGIEAFGGVSQIPVQYRANAACGVILVWTRSGPRGDR